MGLNLTLPADGDLLRSYRGPGRGDDDRIAELVSRVRVLEKEGEGRMNVDKLYEYNEGGRSRFRVNTPETPSYIKINGNRFDVESHIGSGAWGTVCRIVREGVPPLVLKMQILENIYDIVYNVREAINNFIWSREYPAMCNIIHGIVIKYKEGMRRRRIYFILESLNKTMTTALQQIGVPPYLPEGIVAVPGFTQRETILGTGIKGGLCRLAQGLALIHDNLGGTHGDLHCNNFMDGKLIDYGYSRMVKMMGGVEWTIQCKADYNNKTSESRDLTYFVWNLWHHTDCRYSTAKEILKSFLNFPNPAPYIYNMFEPWWRRTGDRPSHIIHKIGNEKNDFPPEKRKLYYIFNDYENPNCTFIKVQEKTCPLAAVAVGPAVAEAVGPAVAVGGRRSRNIKNKRARRATCRKKTKLKPSSMT